VSGTGEFEPSPFSDLQIGQLWYLREAARKAWNSLLALRSSDGKEKVQGLKIEIEGANFSIRGITAADIDLARECIESIQSGKVITIENGVEFIPWFLPEGIIEAKEKATQEGEADSCTIIGPYTEPYI
jgi:hypothetical protein